MWTTLSSNCEFYLCFSNKSSFDLRYWNMITIVCFRLKKYQETLNFYPRLPIWRTCRIFQLQSWCKNLSNPEDQTRFGEASTCKFCSSKFDLTLCQSPKALYWTDPQQILNKMKKDFFCQSCMSLVIIIPFNIIPKSTNPSPSPIDVKFPRVLFIRLNNLHFLADESKR